MMAIEIGSALCIADKACSILQFAEDFMIMNAEMRALGRENQIEK